MSFWVYLINKGEIVAAADTRITWTNEQTQHAHSTEDGLKILNISNNHSHSCILVTGYPFWEENENFEKRIIYGLNQKPDHSAKDIAVLLQEFSFKSSCYLGLLCFNHTAGNTSWDNLNISVKESQKTFSLVETGGKYKEMYYADSSNFINDNPQLQLLSPLDMVLESGAFKERAAGVVEGIVKSYSNPSTNSSSHRSTVSDTADIIVITQTGISIQQMATRDATPFYPGPFNRQPTSNVVQAVPSDLVDLESALSGRNVPPAPGY